jgi:hypothetical protein
VIYCFDTSGFLQPWNDLYPPDVFPGFWSRLEQLIASEKIISPLDVLKELERRDDDLHAWAKKQRSMFVELDGDYLKRTVEITNKHSRLIEHKPGRSGADPLVIALAAVRGAAVVTMETYSSKANAPRIPNVCQAEGVACMNVLEFIKRQRWIFAA